MTKEHPSQLEDYAKVRDLLAFLTENWRDQPSLETLASRAHLSGEGVQRLFTRWAGITPKTFLQAITVSTLNFQSFSQLAFSFTLTPAIIIQTVVFSLFMGFIGGFLPALRAARMKIVDSLRAA